MTAMTKAKITFQNLF